MGDLECGDLVAETTGQLEQKPERGTRAKLRLLNNLDMDGRTKAVRAVKSFETQVSADLGNDLTEAQRTLVRRGAVLAAILTDCDSLWAKDGTMDLGSYVTATNSLRRLLVTLGIARVQRAAGVVELMEHD